MRLIDADWAGSIDNLDDYSELALAIGDFQTVRDVLNDAPTIDAVPVSELLELRDFLYENDLIFMQGLWKMNELIAKYAKDGDGNDRRK